MHSTMTKKDASALRISYIHDLQCSDCGKTFSVDEVHTYCPDCQAPILVNYDLKAAREQVDKDEVHRRPKGMWRWHEFLPVFEEQNMVSLGEGDTALLRLPRLGK